MDFFSKFNWSDSILYIFGSLSPKIIVVLAENRYLGRFKALKIFIFTKFPILRENAKICCSDAILLKFLPRKAYVVAYHEHFSCADKV